MSSPGAKLFYRVPEGAELLSQGRTKIYEAIRNGELRSIKVGKSRLIPADALSEYAAKLEDQATESS
jgi:excisionase family DNA binding protein